MASPMMPPPAPQMPPPGFPPGDFEAVKNGSFSLGHFSSMIAVACSIVSVYTFVSTVVIVEYIRRRRGSYESRV